VGRLTARLAAWLREWDWPSKVALFTALALFILALLVAAFGPADLRQPALVGAAGLFLVTQIIILWGNRGMVTAYTKAQRYYVAGDFEAARAMLERLAADEQADANALTLLGNTYRQLGRLDESEASLRQAIVKRPSHYFSLYGFGRTLLTKGNYTEAATILQQALDAGAPTLVQFDLGDARYRQGLHQEAAVLLQAVKPVIEEPYRALMVDYLLFRLNSGPIPAVELIRVGLPYWRASADRFSQTPYGQSLADDVLWMQARLKED
jgi:tetratricopeptide (TPR) repeat protein